MIRTITILFVVLVLLVFTAAGFKLIKKANVKSQPFELIETVDTPEFGKESKQEKEIGAPATTPTQAEQIEDWIKANNLNRYGDPIDFMYTGGSPLFNEQTGEVTDRYDYILKNHPDKPWLK